MTLASLLDTYERFRELRGKHGDDLPEMRLESVRILPTPIQGDALTPAAAAAQLEGLIAAFAPDCGWLCYQSKVETVLGGRLPGADPDRGLLLSGELVNPDNESLHIRQDGQGGWVATRFTPDQGDQFLVDEQELCAHESDPERRKDPGRLHYRRYWCLDPQHGIRQTAARFIGFIGFDEGH